MALRRHPTVAVLRHQLIDGPTRLVRHAGALTLG
jgi:hypothetical protein